MRRRLSRRFAAALVLSLLLHAVFTAFVPASRAEQTLQVTVVHTTALHVQRLPKPQPKVETVRPKIRVRTPQVVTPRAAPAAQAHKELAKITPRATRYQPKQIVRKPGQAVLPQPDFQKTIAQLRQANDPVTGAQRAVEPGAAATRRYSSDISGTIGTATQGVGYLEPVQDWTDSGYDYYRVRYRVQYPDGTFETGIIPWPIRFRPQVDPFHLGIHLMPLPVPLPDYQLPADATLRPLVAYCFKHRFEVPSCPIAHD